MQSLSLSSTVRVKVALLGLLITNGITKMKKSTWGAIVVVLVLIIAVVVIVKVRREGNQLGAVSAPGDKYVACVDIDNGFVTESPAGTIAVASDVKFDDIKSIVVMPGPGSSPQWYSVTTIYGGSSGSLAVVVKKDAALHPSGNLITIVPEPEIPTQFVGKLISFMCDPATSGTFTNPKVISGSTMGIKKDIDSLAERAIKQGKKSIKTKGTAPWGPITISLGRATLSFNGWAHIGQEATP